MRARSCSGVRTMSEPALQADTDVVRLWEAPQQLAARSSGPLTAERLAAI